VAVVEEIATDVVAEALAGKDVLSACAHAIRVMRVILSVGRQARPEDQKQPYHAMSQSSDCIWSVR